MEPRAVLKKCPLFSGVTDEDLERLVSVVKLRDVEKGELLFSEGETAQGFFVVADGAIKIFKLSPEGKERILHIVQPGGTFAEAAIFGNGLYPAHAEPLQKSQVLFFAKKEFLLLLHQHAQIAINMIGGLSRFLRQFAVQIEELTFKDVPARLACYLLELAGDEQRVINLPISKTQLASRLGTVSETLSRTFRKLSEEALLQVDGKVITILDRDRLEDLAASYKDY